ncbi:MAG TPA: SGNH/GDSL hydrolase family protein [Saprospiraceae bacterium]|nr:SGNH/GDSL hydrolase family protein [Saprospiraceae bacterium]HPN68651.1 SGNH/GDSL hydrolase family protein [Saprospiraceae bacterium]
MKIYSQILFFCMLTTALCAQKAKTEAVKYVDCSQFSVIGKYHQEDNYNRLPAKFEKIVRKEVWDLSLNTAGVSVRFRTNATRISIKWTLLTNEKFPHMAWTGIAGLDLYTYKNGQWNFIETARPKDKTSEYLIFENKNPEYREYLLNLPLYDGVESVFLGVNESAEVTKPKENYLLNKKPIVHYGSSITQGGCASRPGMAYTNILARWLDRSVYNLGFSGEGTFEESVGQAICEMDVAMVIIDCNPNSDTSIICQRAIDLVRQVRKCKPTTPILLLENYIYPDDAIFPENTPVFRDSKNKLQHRKWQKLSAAYDVLKKEKIKNLYYQKGDHLIGDDFEGTVDDSHPTDLGMFRMAKVLHPVINKILAK